jgi:hypothetical protein
MQIKIYKTITLPVALYGCKTWSLALMKDNKLKVFDNTITEENMWTEER